MPTILAYRQRHHLDSLEGPRNKKTIGKQHRCPSDRQQHHLHNELFANDILRVAGVARVAGPAYFGVILGPLCTLWDHFGITLGSLLAYEGDVGALWNHFGLRWGNFLHMRLPLDHSGITLGICGLLWNNFGPFSKEIHFSHSL